MARAPKSDDHDEVSDSVKRLMVVCSVLGYVSAAGCLAIFAYDFVKANREAWRFNAAQNGDGPNLGVVRDEESQNGAQDGSPVVGDSQN